jgi:hypothetical protein
MIDTLQKERSNNTKRIKEKRERLLLSCSVVGDNYWKERSFEGFKKRHIKHILSFLVIQG